MPSILQLIFRQKIVDSFSIVKNGYSFNWLLNLIIHSVLIQFSNSTDIKARSNSSCYCAVFYYYYDYGTRLHAYKKNKKEVV